MSHGAASGKVLERFGWREQVTPGGVSSAGCEWHDSGDVGRSGDLAAGNWLAEAGDDDAKLWFRW